MAAASTEKRVLSAALHARAAALRDEAARWERIALTSRENARRIDTLADDPPDLQPHEAAALGLEV